uniref:F-box associated domain-containing protein n=1 Tax=Arundo donax TaxID=35708 RepID=A0A0A9D9M3_ARUDO
MPLNLVCVKKVQDGSCQLVNPATGVVYHVPKDLAEEHMALKLNPYDYTEDLYLLGRVACTGEYKVLRKVMFSHDDHYGFLYEVCTLSRSHHARWRKMQGHPDSFGWSKMGSVIIDGVAYFLIDGAFLAAVVGTQAFERDCIASFDLETEQWRPNIKGPQSIFLHNAVDVHNNHHMPNRKQLTLANLNGSLVMVHDRLPIWIYGFW